MTVPKLGQLKRVNLRDVWPSEPSDFTPWLALAENVQLLAAAIGLQELEVEAQEKEVGPFRADILCKETYSDHWVLIENQLGRTDHTHLGQIMTYAAGLRAVTIIWVAAQFTEEHRAALDWLNGITEERFRFFGVEVEAWRIGESLPAPKFNVISKPNDWSREVGSAARAVEGGLTDTKRLQLEFWQGFKVYAESHGARFSVGKPQPQSWLNFAVHPGCALAAIASMWNSRLKTYNEGELRAEFAVMHANGGTGYRRLLSWREEIEAELGESLTWYSAEGVKQKRIYLDRDADLGDRAMWPEYHAWLTESLNRVREVLLPYAQKLDFVTAGQESEAE